MSEKTKMFKCCVSEEDVLTVILGASRDDVSFMTSDGTEVILERKAIRKLRKLLKEALPKKASKEKAYASTELSGNVGSGDTVRILRPDMEDLKGVVLNSDYDDHIMPLYLKPEEGPAYWPAMGDSARVIKLK